MSCWPVRETGTRTADVDALSVDHVCARAEDGSRGPLSVDHVCVRAETDVWISLLFSCLIDSLLVF